jgi:hypothetical protein
MKGRDSLNGKKIATDLAHYGDNLGAYVFEVRQLRASGWMPC